MEIEIKIIIIKVGLETATVTQGPKYSENKGNDTLQKEKPATFYRPLLN